MNKKIRNLALVLGTSSLALPIVAASCSQNQGTPATQITLKSPELRKQYRENNVLYNTKIAEFAKKLKTLKDEYATKKDELKKLKKAKPKATQAADKAATDENKAKLEKAQKELSAVEDKIFDLFFEAKHTLRPLVQKYNYLFNALRKAENEEKSELKTIKIFHSNDEHGRLIFDDYKYNKYSGIARTGKYLDDKNYDILVSAGDLIQGLPLSDSDKGKTITEITKYLGYDSIAIGNHEFDYGLQHILDLNNESTKELHGQSTPFISANIYYKDYKDVAENERPAGYDQNKVGQRVFKPYIIKEVASGIKVAIFGITTPDTKVTSHPKNSVLVDFRDPTEESNKIIDEIKAKYPDITFFIATTHLGTGRNKVEWTSDYLSQHVKGDLDLIIDGHSHTYVPINKDKAPDRNIWITQTEAYTKYLGDIDVTFNTKTGEIQEVHQVLRDINQIEIYTTDLSDKLISRLKEIFDKENSVKVFTSPAEYKHTENKEIDKTPYWIGRIQPTGLGVFASDAVAWEFAKAKVWEQEQYKSQGFVEATLDNSIGLFNGGGLRVDLKKGEITRGDALALSPFGNRTSTVRVKGDVLEEALKHGLSKARSGGFSQLSSNVTYEVEVVKGLSEKTNKQEHIWKPKVETFKINGKAIDKNQYYYISTNDFILSGGDGYKMLDYSKHHEVVLAYEGGKFIDTFINFAQLTTDEGKKGQLNSELFAHEMSEYSTTKLYTDQKVTIPQEALTNTLHEPTNDKA
ncbi:bifunctional metallophosphatase/5'-nucleotidase [Mycoplasmopsis mucosicanis]|uniref:Bifunctional metallophosphatase/5'-nucleotidase n=1 Tax=Mycoplasmopsis mucosicanis TaxID=458208 RepID=A0A507SJ98_9BACT|nr:bifunctional UDP-sugar hydrolase/5'-nucleotidase [Mycoplasmopsis mucosicanis]TQC51291.1 bifunctional metallophosphatase/5'-nucleotidase [Mycoplasmopsis mucosicanis]